MKINTHKNPIKMKKCLPIFFISCMLLLNSCIISKKVVYVKDMLPDTIYNVMEAPALRVQKGDRLSIVVSSKMPELAVPFNQGLGDYQVNDQGNVLTSSSFTTATNGYLVDANGEIDFPILETLNIEGMTLDRVRGMIKSRLVNEKLISNPIVKVELLNLKINMMGEVSSIGVLAVPEAKITLLEAISRSGGLTNNAATDRITVIREEDGIRKMFVNNIQSKDIFDSPTYYLQQNDIVYVEPRDAVLTPRVENNLRYISTGFGVLAALFSILVFLK